MAVTEISPAGNVTALDHYTGNIASKDAGSPEPTQRVEFISTLGDCTPETFVDRLHENTVVHGKQGLKHKAYHVILSQTHDEADPHDEQAGHRQHVMARALIRNKFPGHMAKLVTQRDNGRWVETPDGERTWQPGKWHTHCIVANASSREAVLEMPDGTERRYAAGRAIDGEMKNIHSIRHGPGGTDELILEHFGYDNARYVGDCREAAKGRGEHATTRDLAQRSDPDGPGYSSHDEVRVKLREARSLADSWDDYVSRLAADGVTVRAAGKGGASYGWTTDEGVAMKERARKIGPDFTRASVEAQCALNAERIAAGEVLEPPERVLLPAPPPAAERPVPVFLTPDGKPPWDRDLDGYAVGVRERGGTYESVARERIDLALVDDWVTDRDHLIAAAPDHGLTVTGRVDEPLIALDTHDGRVEFSTGHLGPEYTGGQIDRRIKHKRKGRDHDRDRRPGSAAERVAERRPADGIRVERVDATAVGALHAANARRAAERLAEQHDRGRAGTGDDGERAGEVGQPDRRAVEANRSTERGADGAEDALGRDQRSSRSPDRSTRTPLRDEAVRGQQERAGERGGRGRGD
ncbi:hypothetical protein [Gordonia sp. 852002-51296_SCH5728562-b]|uniref:hypothetical protein n=1 Tax=Gordonia sp. 852002-51296_SCH5728562-b TaxID=1834101 RepID=UPI0007E9A061|nr:hypothetical protein [Gordonia sp. 852002-51296_SCH5728562-b]OBA40774.1 hypothetical protein A5766_01920 [Gordonia sp. 852002-51296_SCH5728562-b]